MPIYKTQLPTGGALEGSTDIPLVTEERAGIMSAADKRKLDGIPSGGGVADITGTAPIQVTGASTKTISITPASAVAAGSMSAADKAKLDAVPTPSSIVTLAGNQTVSNKTLGSNLAAGGFKITGLGAPTATSNDAATAAYAEAQKTGGVAVLFAQITLVANVINANEYGGPGSSTASTNLTATDVVPWVAPCAGALKNFRVQGLVGTAGATNLTVYLSSGGNTLSYGATAAVLAVGNGDLSGEDITHTITVARGDCLLIRSDATWNHGGVQLDAQWIPTSA